MTILKTAIASTTLLLATLTTAGAYDNGPSRIDRTQAWQRYEIEQARRSGQLTRREYGALQAEQARIAEMERRAKADGYVSPHERRDIREAQRQAETHIYTESHDRQVNYWRRWKSQHGY